MATIDGTLQSRGKAETCKLNRVNLEAWLAWVLERIQDHPANRIGELMPWAYQAMVEQQKAELEAKTVA